jgi:flagellar basal-body rod protein FlgB
MYNDLTLFRIASGLADHASTRQMAVTQNIANADTPGYRARDVEPFSTAFHAEGPGGLRATRSGHFTEPLDPAAQVLNTVSQPGDGSPNGNGVSLETEMMKATEVRQSHQLALSVYRSGLDLLRTGLGRAR